MTIRVVLQAIENGSLLVDNVERYVSVGRGVIIYAAFMGDVDDTALQQAVCTILSTRMFHHLSPSSTSPVASLSLDDSQSADILIVPQASLGGKIKGKGVQFHALVHKTRGADMYGRFCQLMRSARGIDPATVDSNGVPFAGQESSLNNVGSVISGTYGNRQALQFKSDGPMTHFFDL